MKAIIAVVLVLAVSGLRNMGTWNADPNSSWAKMSLAEKQQYTGTLIPLKKAPASDLEVEVGALPTNFDPRTVWPTCIHPILDQEQCGSCWAFGATESLSDRACIATNGATNVVLSPEDLVSCDTENYGCNGGYLNYAWSYMQTTGVVTWNCFPYTAGSGNAPVCATACADGEAWTPYFAGAANSLTIPQGQQEMMTNGPIETAFDVYEDFFSYTSGVYVQNSTQFVGGHAIKVLGWGFDTEVNLNYWLAQNSWGNTWGMSGYFWIGYGQCGFDSNFIVGPYAASSSQI